MLNSDQRGFMEATALIDHVCLLPWASIYSLAEAVYQSLQARGYAHIDPKEVFIDEFVRQFRRSEHRVDAVA